MPTGASAGDTDVENVALRIAELVNTEMTGKGIDVLVVKREPGFVQAYGHDVIPIRR